MNPQQKTHIEWVKTRTRHDVVVNSEEDPHTGFECGDDARC